jgi:hypothetical protein
MASQLGEMIIFMDGIFVILAVVCVVVCVISTYMFCVGSNLLLVGYRRGDFSFTLCEHWYEIVATYLFVLYVAVHVVCDGDVGVCLCGLMIGEWVEETVCVG